MRKSVLQVALFLIGSLSWNCALAQSNPAVSPKPVVSTVQTSGTVTVNGTESRQSMPLFVGDRVITPASSHASVTTEGNSLLLAPNTEILIQTNAFYLISGGTKVATYTGISTHVNCWAVIPNDPAVPTNYEVNWANSDVFVYARKGEVKIDGAGRSRVLKEGQTARISNVRVCKWLVDVWPHPNLGPALGAIGTSAAVTAEPFISFDPDDKPLLSATAP